MFCKDIIMLKGFTNLRQSVCQCLGGCVSTISHVSSILLFVIFILPVCHGKHSQALDVMVDNMTLCTADLQYTYTNPKSGNLVTKSGILARYGASSKCISEHGVIVHLEDEKGRNHGCKPHRTSIPHRQWVALVQRGQCKFDEKIYMAAVQSNASAVIVYNHKDEGDLPLMYHMVGGVVAVFVRKPDGEALAALVDAGLDVAVSIRVRNVSTTVVSHSSSHHGNSGDARQAGGGLSDAAANSGMLLYISLTLVIVLIVGLGGLLVYGVYRTKQRQAQRHNTRVVIRQPHHAKPGSKSRPVYSESGEVRGFLVEERVPPGARQDTAPGRGLQPKGSIYTTIIEEDEEEEEEDVKRT